MLMIFYFLFRLNIWYKVIHLARFPPYFPIIASFSCFSFQFLLIFFFFFREKRTSEFAIIQCTTNERNSFNLTFVSNIVSNFALNGRKEDKLNPSNVYRINLKWFFCFSLNLNHLKCKRMTIGSSVIWLSSILFLIWDSNCSQVC